MFESFQEELLHFASLSDNDLTQSSDISKFSVLNTKILLMIYDVFSLFLDDLIMLVLYKIFFLFEVLDNLLKRFFQDGNFTLVNLNLFTLAILSVLILILSTLVKSDITLQIFVSVCQSSNLTLVVIDSVPL